MISVCLLKDKPVSASGSSACLEMQKIHYQVVLDVEHLQAMMAVKIPDIVVIDEMSADIDGLEVVSQLRTDPQTQDVGIVYIAGQKDSEKRIAAIELADSFVDAPLECRELVAVINSLARRLKSKSTPASTLAVPAAWRLTKDRLELETPTGHLVSLTFREMTILAKLAQAGLEPVSVKELVEALGENWLYFEKNRLELMLSRLRTKIKSVAGSENPIRSVRNSGYKLMFPIEIVE